MLWITFGMILITIAAVIVIDLVKCADVEKTKNQNEILSLFRVEEVGN